MTVVRGQKASHQMVAVWSGNSAAVPPIAAVPEFGGIGKLKESPRIRGHSNCLSIKTDL